MEFELFFPLLLLFLILFIMRRNRQTAVAKKIIKKRKTEGKSKMNELAKRFIDKQCLIYAFDSNFQFEGVIKEVTDGAILVEKDGKIEAINLDYVIRIREYPKNKKGKRIGLVVD